MSQQKPVTADELDKTLDEILQPWLDEVQSEYGTGINDEDKPAFIAIATAKPKIKQAFIDAGWFIPADAELVQQVLNMRAQQKVDVVRYGRPDLLGPVLPVDQTKQTLSMSGAYYDAFLDTIKKEAGLMTGQEWYQKFEKELTHIARWKDLAEDAYPRTENDATITVGELLGAAKKASGLE